MSRTRNFLKSLKNIGNSAQVHGIPRIFGSEPLILKLVWILAFLGSVSVCIYFFQRTLIAYLGYPIVTNIYLVNENPMEFPTITICSLIPPIKSYNLSDTVYSCYYNHKKCGFEPYFIKIPNQFQQYKTCYQFNSGYNNTPILNVTKSGFYNGLIINLFDGLFDEPRNDILDRFNSIGFEVFLTNKSDLINGDGIIIPPGYSTFIKIKKTVDNKLSEPYNNCIKDINTYSKFDTSLYTQILNSNMRYTQKNCLDYAFVKTVNCSTTYDKILSGCGLNNLNIRDNLNNFLTAYFNFYADGVYLEYLDKCPLECDTISFQTTVSHSFYPSNNNYYGLLNDDNLMSKFPNGKATSIDELRKSVYELSIFFEDLKVTQISQQSKLDIWDLISSIGGLFGLFLGFSFLSLIDIIHILIEFFIAFCKSDSKNNIASFKG